YKVLQLRQQVFTVEQNCNYLDIDNKDLNAYHIMAWDKDILVAYVRLLAPNVAFEEMSIGRVLTNINYRKRKIGIELMREAIRTCILLYGRGNIKIGAQLYLKKFYESFGFKQVSDIYLEDNIEHIKMILINP
ncbi:MAG: GNAT family N-acetyltransferase, partial [Sediminibacterium sp.]|nr:GNAT family N-acetyltransferase [Sediminibacterium sp.]